MKPLTIAISRPRSHRRSVALNFNRITYYADTMYIIRGCHWLGKSQGNLKFLLSQGIVQNGKENNNNKIK